MIILNHRHIIETHTVIGTTSMLHRHLICQPMTRRRLTSIEQSRLRAGDEIHHLSGSSSNATHSLEEVEHQSFTRE
ncbi:Uncharacterised protein [Chlamydia trachomatis]|nr:Uncharacterised protein [Chlamydia trachomatis]